MTINSNDSDEWVHPTLRRFAAFEFTPHLLRGRYALWLQCLLGGILILVLCYTHIATGGLFIHPWVGALFSITGIAGIVATWNSGRKFQKWISHAVPIKAIILMANSRLFKKGSSDAPCAVLFSLQSGYTNNLTFLFELGQRMYALRGTKPTDPDLKEVAHMVEDERFVPNRRRMIPTSFTGGPKVYIADLNVERRCLWKGQLTSGVLHCLIDPDDEGRIELIPWQVVAGR